MGGVSVLEQVTQAVLVADGMFSLTRWVLGSNGSGCCVGSWHPCHIDPCWCSSTHSCTNQHSLAGIDPRGVPLSRSGFWFREKPFQNILLLDGSALLDQPLLFHLGFAVFLCWIQLFSSLPASCTLSLAKGWSRLTCT